MSFLYPNFLWAFSLLAVPILIYILNLRSYKTVYFSNVAFLSELKKETNSRVQIRNLLILILRLLALSALILAFANPVFQKNKNYKVTKNPKKIIYIDNSMSMTAKAKSGTLLDYAKKMVSREIEESANGTNFILWTDSNYQNVNILNKKELLKRINQIEPTAKSISFNDILKKNRKILFDSTQDYQFLIFSDLQKSYFQFEKIEDFPKQTIQFIEFSPEKIDNISIDSIWTEDITHLPLQNESLHIRLRNHGDQFRQNINLKLFLKDSLQAFTNLSINPNSFKDVKFSYTNPVSGSIEGKLSINDYQLLYDNQFYFSYFIKDKIDIKYYNPSSSNSFIPSFYSDSSFFKFKKLTKSELANSSSENADLIILENIARINNSIKNKIEEWLKQGINIALIPPANSDINSYNTLLTDYGNGKFISVDTTKETIEKLDFQHPIFRSAIRKMEKNLNFPFVKSKYIYQTSNPKEISLLSFSESPAVQEISTMAGKIYLFCFPLSAKNSDLQSNPIISPLFFNMSFVNLQSNFQSLRINENMTFTAPIRLSQNEETVLTIKSLNTTSEFIPQWQTNYSGQLFINLRDNINSTGQYYLSEKNKPIFAFAVNLQKEESSQVFWDKEKLRNLFKEKKWTNAKILETSLIESKQVKTEKPNQYWYYFVLAAFVFILLESLAIKFLRN